MDAYSPVGSRLTTTPKIRPARNCDNILANGFFHQIPLFKVLEMRPPRNSEYRPPIHADWAKRNPIITNSLLSAEQRAVGSNDFLP